MPARLTQQKDRSVNGGWMSFLAGLFAEGHPARLDPRSLSDHMKRDLGFLDGNSTRSKSR